MDVAFSVLGKIPIYTFSLMIAIGSAVGLYWISVDSPQKNLQENFAAGIWALIGAAIIGRATYIGLHWEYFQTHLIEIPQIWLGGISAYGAIAGGILATGLAAVITKTNYGEISDSLIPLITTLAISTWLGCWINGCLYGPQINGWWGIPVRDEWGDFSSRWPLQLVGALLTLLINRGVNYLRERGWLPAHGLAATLQLGCIALTLVWAASFRVDPVPQWRNFGLDTWAALGLIILSIIAAILFLKTNPTTQPANK